jgi:hypothetical protein
MFRDYIGLWYVLGRNNLGETLGCPSDVSLGRSLQGTACHRPESYLFRQFKRLDSCPRHQALMKNHLII